MSLIKGIVYIALMTSSFDVFLSMQIGGTVRFCQVIMIIPYIFLLTKSIINKRLIIPYGFKWLLIWTFIILTFVFNTDLIERSFGYWLWLIINVANIVVIVNLFKDYCSVINLIRIYVYSFLLATGFGLFQFLSAPILHFDTPLVQQWWVPGVFARINGFSYEPSYYATYLLLGWSIVYTIKAYEENTLFSKKKVALLCYLFSAAMVLSSSRMGILMMVLAILFINIYRRSGDVLGKIKQREIKLSWLKYILLILFVLFVGGTFLSTSRILDDYSFLLQGTGVNGTASHTVDDRTKAMNETLEVFYDSPFIGASLGGVAEKIADFDPHGGSPKEHEGGAIFLEVLAASGVVGVIPFIVYFYKIIKCSINTVKRNSDYVCMALLVSLISEMIILQLNQNILRPYFWFHIAVLSAYLRVKMYNE